MSVHLHKAQSPARARVFYVTISDTRTPETDTAGQRARKLIEDAGHEVAGYRVVRDEPAEVAALIRGVVGDRSADAIVTSGGTGVSTRDNTYEAVSALLDKRIDGFGELFRMLSFAEIGPSAMLSRAVGGLCGGIPVFATPGSTAAVELALTRLILPELGHLRFEAAR